MFNYRFNRFHIHQQNFKCFQYKKLCFCVVYLFGYLMFLNPAESVAQGAHKTKIYGKVTDKTDGNPVPFVNVYISGTMAGATTDEKGYFFITENRNLLDPLSLRVGGEWGLQRVADMVPKEYYRK